MTGRQWPRHSNGENISKESFCATQCERAREREKKNFNMLREDRSKDGSAYGLFGANCVSITVGQNQRQQYVKLKEPVRKSVTPGGRARGPHLHNIEELHDTDLWSVVWSSHNTSATHTTHFALNSYISDFYLRGLNRCYGASRKLPVVRKMWWTSTPKLFFIVCFVCYLDVFIWRLDLHTPQVLTCMA